MGYMWTSDFRVGHVDNYISCKSCEKEFIVRGVTIMSKLFHGWVKHCVYCGGSDLFIEDGHEKPDESSKS